MISLFSPQHLADSATALSAFFILFGGCFFHAGVLPERLKRRASGNNGVE
jgi:hypothetical protein